MNKIVIDTYWQQEDNFGDKLTPYILEKLFHVKARFAKRGKKLLGIGSILTHAEKGDTIWGSGLLSPQHLPKSKRINVLAVRGPLTRKYLKGIGVKIGNVPFGDPALLLPKVYKPKVEKQYKIGITPHYVDISIAEEQFPKYHLIRPDLPIEEYIDEVNKCELIVSSSLHGLICSDAYGIPNSELLLSDMVLGNGFKFKDYKESKEFIDLDGLEKVLKLWIKEQCD
jgi:pyruvyltransferase